MSEPSFFPYQKIPHDSRHWPTDPKFTKQLKKTKWIATEKIHGANFCFITDGISIWHAKRTGIIPLNENFYGFRTSSFLPEFNAKIVASFNLLPKNLQKIASTTTSPKFLYIYGELFGGLYSHSSLPPAPHPAPVQNGIQYSPNLSFIAFDIAYWDGSVSSPLQFLNYDAALTFATTAKIPICKPLLTASFEKVVAYPLGFDSTIPGNLGLPALAGANKAEGIVIRPVTNIWITDTERAIMKLKIPEFAESKQYQTPKHDYASGSASGTAGTDSSWIQYEIDALVTSNRLDNAMSKVGSLAGCGRGDERVKEVLENFVEDVMGELVDAFDMGDVVAVRRDVEIKCRAGMEEWVEYAH